MWSVFIAFPTRYGLPVRPVTVEEQLALSEDDEEEDDEGGEDEESDGGWSPEDRDFVPEDLTDLKMRIKVTGSGKARKRRKGGKPTRDLQAEAAEDESEEEDERVFSNNYSEVCKFSCNVCGEEVDSDQLKKHMTRLHGDAADQLEGGLDGGGNRFHKKTWHRCGICGKQVLQLRRWGLAKDSSLSCRWCLLSRGCTIICSRSTTEASRYPTLYIPGIQFYLYPDIQHYISTSNKGW